MTRPRRALVPRVSGALLADLAARLTPRDLDMLALLHEHRVLTTHQLCAVYFTNPATARHRLLELHQLAAVERMRPWRPTGSAPWHYVLGPAGAAVLAARRGITITELGYTRQAALNLCLSRQLGHLLGVNDFFTSLHAYARRRGDRWQLAAWWSQARCAALWGDLARPDGYGQWTDGRARLDFFLEHDTGTEPLDKVTGKIAGYAALADTTGLATPVLIWLPSARRETHLRQLLSVGEVPVATAVHTPAGDVDGPAGPVWLPVGSTGPRRRLIELAAAWPRMRGQR